MMARRLTTTGCIAGLLVLCAALASDVPNLEGKPLLQASDTTFIQDAVWSPDASKLLLHRLDIHDNYRASIAVINADGTGYRQITEGPKDGWPVWSPDGRRIAFASERDGNRDIYLLHLHSNASIRLTSHPAEDTHPDWSPDGERIAFISKRTGVSQVHFATPDGSQPTIVTKGPGEKWNPRWSPDGKRLAFYGATQPGKDSVYVMPADGSELKALAAGVWPSWATDGSRLLYVADGSVYEIRTDGSDNRLLIDDAVTARWSPEGTRIALVRVTWRASSGWPATSTVVVTAPLPDEDRIRLAEAFSLARGIQDHIWPGWSEAPFALLLVTDDYEYLVHHPDPSADFTALGYDSLLDADVYARPRSYPTHLLATFPAVGGVPTIVIGQPENTGLSSTFWVITVLHEHFHQLQNSRPDYWDAVAALDLSGGDETGMWMLEYPFPYDSTLVADRFAAYRDALVAALDSRGAPARDESFQRHAASRTALREALSDADYRYLSFQLWQEGVARYVEMRAATYAASAHTPLGAFGALDDFVPYKAVADTLAERLVEELQTLDLREARRIAFYPTGAGEALLLDTIQPDWKRRYFEEKFEVERLFPSPRIR